MFKTKLSQILAGVIILLSLVGGASAQLIYGNTFPFWNVNGPLTVVGTTTLTGATTQTGAAVITGALTQSGGNVSLSGTTVGITGVTTITGATGITGATAVTGALSATTTVTGTTAVVTGGYFQTAAPRTVTGDATVAATDSYIIANKAGTIALTLPDPTTAANTGRRLCVKTSQAQTVTSATSIVVPLITASAGTAILAGTAGKWACMVSDATNWVIMEAN